MDVDRPSENVQMTRSSRLDLRPGDGEPVVLLISRREVDQADPQSVVSRLKVLLASREDAWRYRGQMTRVVDGYNNAPRELVNISEVRSLLRRLEAEWPHWAFFFNYVDDSIKLMLSCMAGSRHLGNDAVEMHAELMAAAMARAFGSMNTVFERFNFPEDELELMSRGFVEVLLQQIDPTIDTGVEYAAEHKAAMEMQKA